MTPAYQHRTDWLRRLLSTEPADRTGAESAIRRLYGAAGFAEPQQIIWFDSPFEATWAVALLIAPHHGLWANTLASGLSKDDAQRVARATAVLAGQIGAAGLEAARSVFGAPRGQSLQFPPVVGRMFSSALLEARHGIVDDIMQLFTVHGDDDALAGAENHFWGGNRGALRSALHCPTTDSLIGQSFYSEYSFSQMADDQEHIGDRTPPAVLAAAWDVGRASGLWWPFEGGAIMSDRPSELHVNERHLLERGDGPAVVYRDGRRVYAWNGKAVPERWIEQTASVPAREFKGFDPTFRKYAEAKARAAAARAAAPVARRDLAARYRAGEHRAVWTELVGLGPAARQKPYADEALEVAHETMRRVEANLRTLIERLRGMGYVFADAPHIPPARQVHKEIARIERRVGALPLSLRTFYEVVGAVDLTGTHPTLAPARGPIAPDPLLVYALSEDVVEPGEDDDAAVIIIAPDDLHKADVSGGDPYEMALPDARADGELLNERHHVFFVEYLRLCFTFGGFPGYEGAADVPPEIATLRAGLLDF